MELIPSRAQGTVMPFAVPAGRLKITETFHSIQGESTFAGLPCFFVRLAGCPLRCRWCDTEYSFQGGEWRTFDELLAQVDGSGCRLVEITGGEPLSQPGSLVLMKVLADRGYTVLLETSGALPVDGVDERVHRIIDLKCPGSGEEAANRWTILDQLRPTDQIKFVIADRRDYEWARDVIGRHRLCSRIRVLVSPVHGELAPRDLAAWVLADKLEVRFQLQLHKYVWPAETRGV